MVWRNLFASYPKIETTEISKNKVYHYNYLVGRIVDLIPYEYFHGIGKITIYLDLYFSRKKVRRKELEKYIKDRFSFKGLFFNIEVKQMDSATNNGLQVVNFVAYAFFRYLEQEDESMMDTLHKSELTVIKKQIY